jgi:DNA modification methylase
MDCAQTVGLCSDLYNRATLQYSLMTKFDLRRQDCITGMSRLANDSVELVVTSPPYNLGVSYSQYSDRQDRRTYLDWCRKWAEQIRRVLKPNGSFFLNIGAAPSNPMLPHEIVMTLRHLFSPGWRLLTSWLRTGDPQTTGARH